MLLRGFEVASSDKAFQKGDVKFNITLIFSHFLLKFIFYLSFAHTVAIRGQQMKTDRFYLAIFNSVQSEII